MSILSPRTNVQNALPGTACAYIHIFADVCAFVAPSDVVQLVVEAQTQTWHQAILWLQEQSFIPQQW